ncbi:MAG: flagellar basal-body MS-ring/collar protein FliF [Bacillota bacterium]|nr:flagellar basal-body MS-ring/collar protein FliF [Bacillota bacterium]
MSKLSEIFVKLKEKFLSMSTMRKIAFGIILLAVIASIMLFVSYSNANKYGILFANLSSEDGKTITDQLTAKKVDTVVKGNTIYVPKGQVDSLRLELANTLSNGSTGYELMDSSNSFGMTDAQFQLNKLRATEGELERTIKSFQQIQNARVHITPSEESVFVKDSQPAKAAIYVQLKPGTKLSAENVGSIMALVAGSVENLPKENIQVIDDKLNLLSKDISTQTDNTSTTSIENQQSAETDFNKKLESALLDMLEPVIGKGKVNVKINSDLDFDSKQKTVLSYDPNKVEESMQTSKETDPSGSSTTSASPVDNNMSNTTPATGEAGSSVKESQTVNYKVGQTETKEISAPGEVKRITSSVVINGKLDAATQNDIEKLVAGVIGYNQSRGDQINVVGMAFDTSAGTQAAKEFTAMQQEAASQQRMNLIKTIAISTAALVALIVFIIVILRLTRKKQPELTPSIDVVIGGEVPVKEPVHFQSLNLDADNEKTHLEQEIKKYATEKPEQVADIIKSWLAEDER